MSERNELQTSMWRDWKESGDPVKMEALLTELDPLVKYTISRYAGHPISYESLHHKALTIARDAMPKYDPTKSQLGTYIVGQLKQMDRFVKKYQNITYLPEYLSQEFGRYSEAKKTIEKRLDRQATLKELSERMGIAPKNVERIQAAMAPQSLIGGSGEIAGGDILDTSGERQDDIIAYLREELEGNERKAFDFLSGKRGQRLSSQATAEKMGIDVQDIYTWRRRWSRILKKYNV